MPQQKQTIIWEAPEFRLHKKSPAWYLIFGIIALLLIVFAAFSKSIMTVITFVLLILLSYAFAVKPPKSLRHSIGQVGIKVGNVAYPYKNIKTFWVVYNPPDVKTLNFETTAYLNNPVSVELGDQDPVEVKMLLKNFLVEDLEREESLSEVIARKARF